MRTSLIPNRHQHNAMFAEASTYNSCCPMPFHVVTEYEMATGWAVEKALGLRMLRQPATPCWVPFINSGHVAAYCIVKLELEKFQLMLAWCSSQNLTFG